MVDAKVREIRKSSTPGRVVCGTVTRQLAAFHVASCAAAHDVVFGRSPSFAAAIADERHGVSAVSGCASRDCVLNHSYLNFVAQHVLADATCVR